MDFTNNFSNTLRSTLSICTSIPPQPSLQPHLLYFLMTSPPRLLSLKSQHIAYLFRENC